MIAPFFHRCWVGVNVCCALILTTVPLLAQEEAEGDESPDWVLSFALMILFLGLTLFILLRPLKRSDTAFSSDELRAQKDEAINKRNSH